MYIYMYNIYSAQQLWAKSRMAHAKNSTRPHSIICSLSNKWVYNQERTHPVDAIDISHLDQRSPGTSFVWNAQRRSTHKVYANLHSKLIGNTFIINNNPSTASNWFEKEDIKSPLNGSCILVCLCVCVYSALCLLPTLDRVDRSS